MRAPPPSSPRLTIQRMPLPALPRPPKHVDLHGLATSAKLTQHCHAFSRGHLNGLPSPAALPRDVFCPPCASKVMAMFDGEALATSASQSGGTATASSSDQEEATTVGVILDSTAFYSEAGGQVSDCGRLLVSGDGGDDAVTGVVEVADVRMFGGFALHVGRLVSGR